MSEDNHTLGKLTKDELQRMVVSLNNEQGVSIAFSVIFNMIASRSNNMEHAMQGVAAVTADLKEKVEFYFAGKLDDYKIDKKLQRKG